MEMSLNTLRFLQQLNSTSGLHVGIPVLSLIMGPKRAPINPPGARRYIASSEIHPKYNDTSLYLHAGLPPADDDRSSDAQYPCLPLGAKSPYCVHPLMRQATSG